MGLVFYIGLITALNARSLSRKYQARELARQFPKSRRWELYASLAGTYIVPLLLAIYLLRWCCRKALAFADALDEFLRRSNRPTNKRLMITRQ